VTCHRFSTRGLVELVRQHPPLGVELLRDVGIFALPAEVTAVLGSEDMSDIILGVASDAAHEHLEELMGITYKSKFVDGWYQQGRAAGEAKGKAEGIAEGEARTRAEDILRILNSRGLSPTRAERELIDSCDDLARLDIWFDRALTVMAVAMVFED
jgi:hypothetical protein